jgi:dihydrolipoamide dehydrogenase
VAQVIHESRRAADWGVIFSPPEIDLRRMRSWKSRVVESLTGGLGQLTKQRKIRHLQGRARFVDAATLAVDLVDGGAETIALGNAILATGSRPASLPGLPGESELIMDSTSALEIDDVPGRLLVVGGGYIGLELGSVYAALGSKVTVVEMLPGLLPGADRDLVRPLVKGLETEFAEILLQARVADADLQKNGVRVTLEGEGVDKPSRLFDRVLVAVGRRPNSENLGLENTGAQIDEQGFVTVDAQMRTAEPNLFAIGDLVGQPMLAHKASHEGRVAVETIAGRKAAFDPAAIPAVVFTDPEVAWCGLTESAAKEEGREVTVARFPWAASGRAKTLGRDDGMTKLVIDPGTERILGVGIVGPGAGELIAEGVLAVEMAALASDLKLTIHPHPTLSETVMEAAEVFFGQSTHVYRPKRR